MPATSGPTSPTPFGRYDPEACCWRTFEGTFDEDSPPFSPTLPPWGMTRGGVLYELPTPELRTSGSVSSSLLKTPTAQLAVNGGSQHPDKRKAGGHGPTLADEVEHLLPTPRATDGTKGGPNQRGSSGDLMLPSAVLHLLPTPTARDWKGENQRRDPSCLPGVFTSPPSEPGSASSAAQLPGQLSLADAVEPTD